jgi:hypothetical protein
VGINGCCFNGTVGINGCCFDCDSLVDMQICIDKLMVYFLE